MIETLASIVFIVGYILIALENRSGLNKAGIALSMGGVLWILVAILHPMLVEEELLHTGGEIFSLIAFLLAAMSLVEIAGHYRLFDIIREKICSYRMSIRMQFVVISTITFILSAVLDNLTTTIVMIQIARRFFWGKNLLIAAAAIVIAANAGGAFSPIGDVTTIMLWLADKFHTLEIIGYGFIPSAVLLVISTSMLVRKIEPTEITDRDAEICKVTISRSEKTILGLVGLSFLMPIIVKTVNLPPVLGILFGLGITWISIDFFKRLKVSETHLTATIEHLIQKSDLASIKFFIGILLAVSALNVLGLLEHLSNVIYADGSLVRVLVGNVGLGLLSALLDNIPLTAIAIEILTVTDPGLWVMLALSVGTGGSLLSLGSAAGVIATGMVKELTFGAYMKIATIPALVSFIAAMAVWYGQWLLIG